MAHDITKDVIGCKEFEGQKINISTEPLDIFGITTLADGSKLKTSAAPTADVDIPNKKYVDDADALLVPYTGATGDVDLGLFDLAATDGTFSGNVMSNGSGKKLTLQTLGSPYTGSWIDFKYNTGSAHSSYKSEGGWGGFVHYINGPGVINKFTIDGDIFTSAANITDKSWFKINAKYNQASGANDNNDLWIDRTETSISSGAQKFIKCSVGGVDKFTVSNEGDGYFNGKLGIGTTTPTQPLSVKEKVSMTEIGGIAIKLTNKTGSNSVAGQLVKADTATNDAVILTAANDAECFGVFLDAGIADGSEAWVVVSGIADVAMTDNTAATRGNWVENSAEAGYADATNASPLAAPQHFDEIGHCIESVSAGGEGTHILARCVLHFN